MGEKKSGLSKVFLVIVIILIVVIVALLYIQTKTVDKKNVDSEDNVSKMKETINDEQNTTLNEDDLNENLEIEENVILYNGIEIVKATGVQTVVDMEINDESIEKYNTTYYNYENGKYEGITTGEFGEETYEGVSIVTNVKKIAMTQEYNAIPRKYKVIEELPEQLIDMADCSSVDINEIDLDGDGKNEYLVCYTVNYAEGEIGDGEPQASSGIMLFDNNYKKIDDLVILENGFWANIKEENYKVFLSLDDVDYIDIDNDGIMEIIIRVPTYEITEISIVKYSNNKIEGETNVKANLEA